MSVSQLRRLVGNPHAYALQNTEGSYYPVRESLSSQVLAKHLRGDITVGTYVLWGDKARTLVFDIDDGDMDMAYAIVRALVELGVDVRNIGIEFSGRKGYHVWVLAHYASARDLRRLGRAAAAEVGFRGEVFPKQDAARDLGNLVKLPLGVHRVTGKPSRWEVAPGVPMSVSDLSRLAEGLPEVSATGGGGTRPEPFPCMERIQQGVGEGGRNINLFHLAVMVRRGGLSDENAELVVRATNEKCSPPLDEAEVANLLESSKNSGPLCRQLEGSETHCGEACITHRGSLSTRPGQVRYAAPGERIVVEVEDRTDAGTVYVRHPDAAGKMGVS